MSREDWTCQLGREARVHGAAQGPHDEFLLAEVERLHREREWACQQLVEATGDTISQVRHRMRRAMGQNPISPRGGAVE